MGFPRRRGHDWPELYLLGRVQWTWMMLWHRLEINKEVEQSLFPKEIYQSPGFADMPTLGLLFLLPLTPGNIPTS